MQNWYNTTANKTYSFMAYTDVMKALLPWHYGADCQHSVFLAYDTRPDFNVFSNLKNPSNNWPPSNAAFEALIAVTRLWRRNRLLINRLCNSSLSNGLFNEYKNKNNFTLLTSNDRIMIICGEDVKSLIGTGIWVQMYSVKTSILNFKTAEIFDSKNK